jgi:hypothetical protein
MTVLKYPMVFHGACMHPVDPKQPERAFSKETLILNFDDDFPLHVGYAPACVKEFDLGGHRDLQFQCNCPWPHGHVLMHCDEGSAWIPAPVASGAMIEEIIKEFTDKDFNFSAEKKAEMARILRALTEHILPDWLTGHEKSYLANMAQDRHSLRVKGWYS